MAAIISFTNLIWRRSESSSSHTLTIGDRLNKVLSREWNPSSADLIHYVHQHFNLNESTLPDEVKWQLFHAAHAREIVTYGDSTISLGEGFCFKHEKMRKPRELAILYHILNRYSIKEEADLQATRTINPSLQRTLIFKRHIAEMQHFFLHLHSNSTWNSQEELDDFRRQLILELEVFTDPNLNSIIERLKHPLTSTIIPKILSSLLNSVGSYGFFSIMPSSSQMMIRNLTGVNIYVLCPRIRELDQQEEMIVNEPMERLAESQAKLVLSAKWGKLALVYWIEEVSKRVETRLLSIACKISAFIIPFIGVQKPTETCKVVARARIERLRHKIFQVVEPEIRRLKILSRTEQEELSYHQLRIVSREARILYEFYSHIFVGIFP